MDHLRRQLLTGIAAVGAAMALPPMDGLERLRFVVDQAVGEPTLEEWEETAWEYAHQIVSRPLHAVIADLSVELLALQRVMPSEADHEDGWARVNTRMTLLLAHALGSAGHSRESRLWWASARRAAAHAGDDMTALVSAFEAVQGLYENRPLPLILSRADAALAATRGRPCVAAAKALGARAHAHALLGDTATAYTDLDNQARVYDQLPDHVTRDQISAEGWPITRTLHTRSLVFTLTGHRGAGRAQREAIAAYPRGRERQAAQVQLHVAMSAVLAGDITEGLDHAQTILADLGPDKITRFLLHIAQSVADVIPTTHQAEPAVIEYRKQLALPAPTGGA